MVQKQRIERDDLAYFQQQARSILDYLWLQYWDRPEGMGRRWFRHAWRDTSQIFETTHAVEEETVASYAQRLRQQLEAIRWQYASGMVDGDGYVDEDNWYASVMNTVISKLDSLEMYFSSPNEPEGQA